MIQLMKNQNTRLLLLMLVMGLLAMAGCSDDDDPTGPGGGGNDAPEFTIGGETSIDLPNALESSNDPNAQMVVGYMNQVNALAGMASTFVVPDGADVETNKDGTWTYTWTISEGTASMTIIMVVTETSEWVSWALSFDGTDGEVFYDEFLVYEAQVAKDESWGSFSFYDFEGEPGDAIFSWDWETDSLGVFTMTMVGGSGLDAARIVFVVEPTGAGSLDIYEMGAMDWVLVIHYEWTALGNGAYAIYDGGVIVDSGTWGGPAN